MDSDTCSRTAPSYPVLTCKLVVRFARLLNVGVVLLLLGLLGSSEAQRAGRRVATLSMLAQHPSFYHAEEVIVHADAVGETVLTYLVDDRSRLLVLDVPPPPVGVRDRLEVIGTFYDVGRLEPDDPRVSELPFERLSRSLLHKDWPGVGEMRLIVAASSTPLAESTAATLRTVGTQSRGPCRPERHTHRTVSWSEPLRRSSRFTR